jgi:8-oxo-dGTP pyrophosphatase MutT (NUDIX family)
MRAMADAASLRAAATVIVLRDVPAGAGYEVLMLRRHARSGFAADMWVFPGGVVDEADGTLEADHWTGIDPAALAPRFGLTPQQVLAHYVAGVRETFEEAGLLLAHRSDGDAPDLSDPALLRLRNDLADRTKTVNFAAWLSDGDLILDLDALTYLSHWVTPSVEPRRYDTRFFLAHAPADQVAGYDRQETTDQRWITPADALAASKAGEMPMIYPTILTLRWLREQSTAHAAIQAADTQPEIRRTQPHVDLDEHGKFLRIIHPDDAAYPHHLYEART